MIEQMQNSISELCYRISEIPCRESKRILKQALHWKK